MLVTALPCRLQNDSPPESINEMHLNKDRDAPPKLLNTVADPSAKHIKENNNLLKSHPKLPPDLECAIDESNYVNLNDITKCKAAIANDFNNMRSAQKATDAMKNGMEKSSQNHINTIDNKNGSKLNNFYRQINSTSTIANGHHGTSKPIMSIVNQKNVNNLSNGCNNIAKNGLTNNINSNNNNNNINNINNNGVNTNNSNGCLAVNAANHLNNNCNGINNNNNNSSSNTNTNSTNCNGVVPNECVIDAKLITTNGIDYNKNGLPTPIVSTPHTQYDVIGGHNQAQCGANKTGGSSQNAPPQSYVIQNGNGLLTNGNASIKEMPRADSNKGKNWPFFCFCFSAVVMHVYAIDLLCFFA